MLNYTYYNPQILGHLVIPVFKPENRQKWYNVLDQDGNLMTPTELSSTTLFNQVVFVPKGVSYSIMHGISQHDKLGFIVIAVGADNYNWIRYFNFDANTMWNRTNTVYDENGQMHTVTNSIAWAEFLSQVGTKRQPYFWKKIYRRIFNRKGLLKTYIPDYRNNKFVKIKHPLGRYEFFGPIGSAE